MNIIRIFKYIGNNIALLLERYLHKKNMFISLYFTRGNRNFVADPPQGTVSSLRSVQSVFASHVNLSGIHVFEALHLKNPGLQAEKHIDVVHC